jgi:radical SAM superfamily enzyme YgiQ (UPF0313 family)
MIANPRILLVYPNIPLMFSPPISMAIFTAICKEMDVPVDLFETTGYTDQFESRRMLSKKKGHQGRGEVDANDWITIKPSKEAIPDFITKVEEFNPDLILISCVEDSFSVGIDLLESIRDKNIPNIMGGVFTTFAPEEVLKYDVVDQLCHQEGEQVLRDAVERMREGKPLYDIPGTTYRHKDHAEKNLPASLVDLNEITPDFSLFSPKRFGRFQGGRYFNFSMQMETYRGCPYQCTYCNSPGQRAFSKDAGTGNFMRRKSADVIKAEFEYYYEQYGVDHVNFIDDSFLARPIKELEEFTKVWSEHKTPFWVNTRIENCTPYIMDLMKEAGMYRITFGLESGNEEYRTKYLKRNVTNEKYLHHIDIINKSNIPYSLNVIIGMPFETKEMALDSARFARACKGHDAFTVSAWSPYHGTELRDIAVQAGFMDANLTWSLEQKLQGQNDGFYRSIVEMPKPYLQNDEIKSLVDLFPLYAYFPDELYPEIENPETRPELLKIFKSEYYATEYQEGGQEKIDRLKKAWQDRNNKIKKFTPKQTTEWVKAWSIGCANHDPSIEDHFGVVA